MKTEREWQEEIDAGKKPSVSQSAVEGRVKCADCKHIEEVSAGKDYPNEKVHRCKERLIKPLHDIDGLYMCVDFEKRT